MPRILISVHTEYQPTALTPQPVGTVGYTVWYTIWQWYKFFFIDQYNCDTGSTHCIPVRGAKYKYWSLQLTMFGIWKRIAISCWPEVPVWAAVRCPHQYVPVGNSVLMLVHTDFQKIRKKMVKKLLKIKKPLKP